jgi:tyrosine-protein kinase Etk/Wzc
MGKATNFQKDANDLAGLHGGVIQVFSHDKLKGEFAIGQRPLIIGRSPECDVILPDSGVSRRHAKVVFNDGKVSIHDLGSVYGITIGNSRVDQAELRSSDEFSIAQFRLRYLSAADYQTLKRSGVNRSYPVAHDAPDAQRLHGDRSAGTSVLPQESYGGGSGAEGMTVLAEIRAAALESWRLIAACTVVALLVGFLHSLLAVPAYMATASVQVETRVRDIGGPFSDFEDTRGSNDALVDEVEILLSGTVLGQAVDNLALDVLAKSIYFPGFGSDLALMNIGAAVARERGIDGQLADPLFGLEQFTWSGERMVVESMEVPADYLWSTFRIVSRGNGTFDVIDADRNVMGRGKAGEPLVNWLPTDEPSLLVVSELRANRGTEFQVTKVPRAAAIENLQLSLVITDAGFQSSILKLSLAGSDPERITQIINEIVSVYVRQNVNVQSDDALRTLRFVEDQIPVAKQRMEAAEAKLNDLRLQRGSVGLTSDTQVVLDKIVRLEAQISELEQNRAQLIERFTPQHPRVRSIDAQLQNLRQSLVMAEAGTRELPTTEREVLSVSREVAVTSELYLSLVNRAQELQVVSAYAATTGNVRVVDNASVPLFPFRPNQQLIIMIYLMLGIATSIGIIMFRRNLRNAVNDPELIEAKLGLPIYATLPHSTNEAALQKQTDEPSVRVLAAANPGDATVEGMRSLRTSLQFAFVNSGNNILLITGPTAGVGKTFVAANLAAVLAAGGRSVVVIDADLRRGSLHEQFAIKREPGLADCIGGDIDLREATQETSLDGLYVLPAGAIPPNPSELLMHERFQQQLSDLSQRFDHVIIDSPPVLAVTDAVILGRLAGVVLLVTKYGVHPMREIELSVKRLLRVGANLKGVVFNDMPMSTGAEYGYGSYALYPKYAKESK